MNSRDSYKKRQYLKRTPRLIMLITTIMIITTMKQFYRVKHSINTLNNKNNKAKRSKEYDNKYNKINPSMRNEFECF